MGFVVWIWASFHYKRIHIIITDRRTFSNIVTAKHGYININSPAGSKQARSFFYSCRALFVNLSLRKQINVRVICVRFPGRFAGCFSFFIILFLKIQHEKNGQKINNITDWAVFSMLQCVTHIVYAHIIFVHADTDEVSISNKVIHVSVT